MIRRTLILVATTALLGACHSGQKAGHGEVSGQILPGSVSDAMLPYDSVKSQAPLAPKEAGGSDDPGGNEAGSDDHAPASAMTAASSDASPADVAASPSPVPSN